MARPLMTYALANACALDAGNANMRRHDRKRWNIDDWNVMADLFHRLWPCPTGAGCPTCDEHRRAATGIRSV